MFEPITYGPKYHWFGYYDKMQFSPDARFVLGLEAEFEHRAPQVKDTVAVGMIDLENDNEWIELARTGAWCWQQGCMLQWIPGSANEIIFNDREGDGFVSRIINVETRAERTVSAAIYTLSPDGRSALGIDFHRTGRLRPGYGYAGTDISEGEKTPVNAGIYSIDLVDGTSERILSIDQIASTQTTHFSYIGKNVEHWLNHVLFSPDGKRFIFLHRWLDRNSDAVGNKTRMFTADPDGSELRCMTDCGMSHFIWRDAAHIHGWARLEPDGEYGQYLFDEATGSSELVGNPERLTANGHMTYLPGGEWILNDNQYERDESSHSTYTYLYHVPSDRRANLGSFTHDSRYHGEFRCDLHPRSSRDGRLVCIDSAHHQSRRISLSLSHYFRLRQRK